MNMVEVNGTHVHAVFQVCCIGSIPLFLISISYIIHQINFSNVQKLIFYFSNVQCDDMQSKDLCIGRVGAWIYLA